MRWRFADLPVRTKFMVTLGIPVLGMVLLIGKQVDSSIKRRSVMDYVKEQSAVIGLYSKVVHELQKELRRAARKTSYPPHEHHPLGRETCCRVPSAREYACGEPSSVEG